MAVVAAAFLLQPLCWWARYTVWIYAVGLPCFAVAAHHGLRGSGACTRANLFRVRGARLWVACCCAALLIEGAWCLLSAGISSMHLQKRQLLENPAKALAHVWRWRAERVSIYAPALKGTVMEGVLDEQEPVACGPFQSQMPGDGRWKRELVGWLSYPLGQRRVYGLSYECDSAEIIRLQRNEVRHVVWDDMVPIPETLCAASERIERAPGLIVLTLRSASGGRP